MSKENYKNEYWGSLEELYNSEEYQISKGLEFRAPPEEQNISKMERRDFLKVMGASMLMATVACSQRSVEKIIPYVNRPEEIIPGIANWYATTYMDGANAYGVLVKTREGRPIKLEGNESHPINQGGLSATVQASLLSLYDPDRLQAPLKVDRVSGKSETISWSELNNIVKSKLEAAKSEGKKVTILTNAAPSPSTQKLIQEFLQNYSESQHVAYDSMVVEEIALASEISFGQKVTPRFRFEKAEYVLTFGANFLGNWLSSVEYAKGFAKARNPKNEKMARLVTVEGALSQTGMNADQHIAVKPGDELTVALGIAHEVILTQKFSSYSTVGSILRKLGSYTPDRVAKRTGVSEAVLKKIAQELVDNQSKAIVLGGPLHGKNAAALEIVVNLLNAALNNDGATIDSVLAPSYQANSSFSDLVTLIDDMSQNKIGVLIIADVNPVLTLAHALDFTKALSQTPFIVTFSQHLDETALASDYVAASSHYLESWNDANPQKDLYSLAQPVIQNLYDTKSFQESLIEWSGISQSWFEYIQNFWQTNIFGVSSNDLSFTSFWNSALQKGFVSVQNAELNKEERISQPRAFLPQAMEEVRNHQAQEDNTYSLSLCADSYIEDGRYANNSWLQELPDPLSKICWDNYLSVSPKLALSKKLTTGDVVTLKGADFELEAPVYIQPKLHEKAMMIAVGYGRKHAGQVGNGVGVNVYGVQGFDRKALTWHGLVVESFEKTGVKQNLAQTQKAETMMGRPLVMDATFDAYQKDPHAGNLAHHNLITLWDKHPYDGYKWGMSIDTNLCTGCSACMVSCQAENNIPTVGQKQVSLGRDMHWIRVDRYYKGDDENPDVAFQPVPCQQCENAPCETVCPVLATVHSDEGLNQMIYNRCVGTRYCANNCPYKVRRFNYFGYDEKLQKPLSLVLNPDVTVRSQGVMEKCTFCQERIRTGKDTAKNEGRKVRDGEIKTACQQTCPSNAIVFGDLNDPQSEVAQLFKSARSYHLLEELNVQPRVAYMTKIRNES